MPHLRKQKAETKPPRSEECSASVVQGYLLAVAAIQDRDKRLAAGAATLHLSQI
jgi:hypothetical protein